MSKQGKDTNKKEPEQLRVEIQEVQQEYSCCDAKLFKIPDGKKWLLTLCLINIPTILHEILHMEWFTHNHLFGALYVLLIAHFINFWTFMNLCLQDPGFIQKIKYGYEIDEQFISIPKSDHIIHDYVVISYIVPNRQMTSRLKFCTTCNIFRPNRTSHCNDCGVCVQRMDHHCPWIGTCVGKRNHKYFYVFLLSLMVLIITTAVMCIMIMVGTNQDPPTFGQRLKVYPMTIVFIIIACLPAFLFVGIMFVFHSYLIACDLTTKQVMDGKWAPIIGNPERKLYCFKNALKLMLKSQQRKSVYKHRVFQYYDNQVEDSSNSQNKKNSKESENSEAKKQKSMNYSSSEQSIHKHPQQRVNVDERLQMEEVETHGKIPPDTLQ